MATEQERLDEKPNSLLDDKLLESSGSQTGPGNLDTEVESDSDSEVGTDDPVAVQCALAPHGGVSERHDTWGSSLLSEQEQSSQHAEGISTPHMSCFVGDHAAESRLVETLFDISRNVNARR